MRLKLTAKASGKTLVPAPVTVLCDPYGISFLPGSDGFVHEIQITKPVVLSKDEIPTTTYTPDEAYVARISTPRSDAEDDLTDLLQYLESLGGFWLGLRNVAWEAAKKEWIPESPDDRRRLGLFSSGTSWSFPERAQPLELALVHRLLADREKNQPYVIPLAFVRDGLNEYKRFRFIMAFFQFFFYLEDLYGHGKWKARQVKEQFLGSSHLKEVSADVLTSLGDPDHRFDRRQIEEHLTDHGLAFDAQGLIELLVDMRGRLHHFSQRDKGTRGHPLNHHEFKGIAFVALQFCLRSYVLIDRDSRPV